MRIGRPKADGRWRWLASALHQPDGEGRRVDTAGNAGGQRGAGSGADAHKVRARLKALGGTVASVIAVGAACAAATVLLAAQFPRQQFPRQSSSGIISMDGEVFPPENPKEKAEWIFARFDYGTSQGFGNGSNRGFGYGGYGGFRGGRRFRRWAADWPKSDRQFILGVKRLTLIQARSTEHVANSEGDDIFNYPWLYVEDPGAWQLNEAQAQKLREYVQRGGFIMLDDSWGDREWATMAEGVHMILPGRPIEDLANDDEIFRVVYDLSQRVQIPGTRYIWGRHRAMSPDEARPRWSAVRDKDGRILIAICHNSDVGDAWEWADSPHYPEAAASESYRIGINYIIYAMTH